MSLLTEADVHQAAHKRTELQSLIAEMLISKDNAALNAALLQAPALEAWQALWQAISDAVETPSSVSSEYAQLFAIPVIIVAGSAKGTHLSCEIKNTEAILALLKQHKVLESGTQTFLLPHLVSSDVLSSISLSQQWEWKQAFVPTLQQGQAPALSLEHSPIFIKEESAWLRFIVGVSLANPSTSSIQLGGNVGSWGMALAQQLGEQLKQEDATVLAIPRAPQALLAAQNTGRQILQETRLQLLASSAIRAIRSKGRTPVAVMAAHENNEIRITFSSQEDKERWQGFVWPIHAGDHVEQIGQFALALFHDCQVSDVRIIDTIQPDRDEGLPFFVTAHFSAKQAH